MSVAFAFVRFRSSLGWRASGQVIHWLASNGVHALLVGCLLLAAPAVAFAGSAPPGDLYSHPLVSSHQTITNPLEIEALSLITNTTSSGAIWVIERRFTYGEASIVIVILVLCLITIFDILLRLAVLRV